MFIQLFPAFNNLSIAQGNNPSTGMPLVGRNVGTFGKVTWSRHNLSGTIVTISIRFETNYNEKLVFL